MNKYYRECSESEAEFKHDCSWQNGENTVMTRYFPLKVLNLSKMVGSHVLMEFRNGLVTTSHPYRLGELESIRDYDEGTDYLCNGSEFEFCRFSDRWQPWFGGDCPLPNGVVVEIMRRDGTTASGGATFFRWTHHDEEQSFDTIAWRWLKNAGGWEYPWEAGQ